MNIRPLILVGLSFCFAGSSQTRAYAQQGTCAVIYQGYTHDDESGAHSSTGAAWLRATPALAQAAAKAQLDVAVKGAYLTNMKILASGCTYAHGAVVAAHKKHPDGTWYVGEGVFAAMGGSLAPTTDEAIAKATAACRNDFEYNPSTPVPDDECHVILKW